MIVEPASLHSRSPLRRLLRGAGFIAPVALLATIVGGGLLGPKPAQDVVATASPSSISRVSAATALPLSPSPSAPGVASPDATVFPAAYRSVPVRSPSEVLHARASAGGPQAMAVVAGYLAMLDSSSYCAAPMITFGAWCIRAGTLYESPRAGSLNAAGSRPPHLHVTVPAGVVLPPGASSASGSPAGSVPVVAVVRFATGGTCAASPAGCDRGFIVERLVWVDGTDVPLQPLIEPGQGAGLDASAPEPDNPEILPLAAVLARPATVSRLDAAAGTAAQRATSLRGPVWYVRDVILARDGALLPRWLDLDPLSGRLLATAPLTEVPPTVVVGPSPGPQG